VRTQDALGDEVVVDEIEDVEDVVLDEGSDRLDEDWIKLLEEVSKETLLEEGPSVELGEATPVVLVCD
jgi:hypothetical protein